MTIEWTSRAFLLFLTCSALAGRVDIAVDVRPASWISKETFIRIVKLSFRHSRCCNIYLSDVTNKIETIFNQFIETYTQEYLVMKEMYYCQGYFLLAPTEDRLITKLQRVPSTISTTELLIVVDSNLNETMKLFNTSLYNNANVNLVTLSGIWSLSENYLEPRRFTKVQRYSDLVHERRSFNFKGRKLQGAAFFHPPHCYLNRTVNRTVNGIEGEFFTADNYHEMDGVEMRILMVMAKKLNFTWTIRKPTGGFRYGRQINATAWNGGMIGQIFRKEIDFAFSGIWLKEDHHLFANLTHPWHELFITFLVPRPHPYSSFWALTRPFTPIVWILLTVVILMYAIYMYLRAWVHPGTPERFRSFIYTLTELIGRLVGTWIPRNTRNVRMALHMWHLASLLLVTAYSSSLAARLTHAEYEDRIDNIRQFIEANLTWGRQGPEPIFHEYFDLSDPYSALLPARFMHEENSMDRRRSIARGNYAIVGRIVESLFFPENNVTNEDLKRYRVMKEKVGKFYPCFAVQPWLLKPFNKILLWLTESGISLYHLHDVIRRRVGLNLREVLVERDKSDGTVRVLALIPLAAGFSFLIVGLVLSAVVFYWEIRSIDRPKASSKEIFRKVEINSKIWSGIRTTGTEQFSKTNKKCQRAIINVNKLF